MHDSRKKVLIVDDEPGIRDSLRLLLKSNFEVQTAEDGGKALEILATFRPDLILLDVIMPNLDGIETLKRIKEQFGDIPVVMLTATNTVKTAVQAMKYGAVDFLNKPFDIEELTSLIVSTLERQTGEPQPNPSVRGPRARSNAPDADLGTMVGRSPLMEELFGRIKQLAERDTTVLVTGESGTGKELIAQQIHQLSLRKNGPFVAINCAAIPESLIESELFGHEKGAFTHAVERRLGHFELADGGTLFLDEIGELSLTVQVKMLRFLQEQEFYRVGRSKPVRVDVRVVAATNKNLEELIAQKTFRQDLYYRINVISLHVPPLRDRFEDINPLVAHFVKKFSPTYGGRVLDFNRDAMDVLIGYRWPGNVRELENVMESLMALSPTDSIGPEQLPKKLRSKNEPESFRTPALEGGMGFEEAERMFETEMILKALRKTNYVQTRAAELLGISRRILKYKMDKLNIPDKPADEAVTVEEPVLPDDDDDAELSGTEIEQ